MLGTYKPSMGPQDLGLSQDCLLLAKGKWPHFPGQDERPGCGAQGEKLISGDVMWAKEGGIFREGPRRDYSMLWVKKPLGRGEGPSAPSLRRMVWGEMPWVN